MWILEMFTFLTHMENIFFSHAVFCCSTSIHPLSNFSFNACLVKIFHLPRKACFDLTFPALLHPWPCWGIGWGRGLCSCDMTTLQEPWRLIVKTQFLNTGCVHLGNPPFLLSLKKTLDKKTLLRHCLCFQFPSSHNRVYIALMVAGLTSLMKHAYCNIKRWISCCYNRSYT